MTDILTELEAAKYLKIPIANEKQAKRAIQRYARLGVIKGRKVGRDWRFHKQGLDSFLIMGGMR